VGPGRRAHGRGRLPVPRPRASALSALAFLPLALLTLAVPTLGIAGVWLAMVMWMVARAALNERRYRSGQWIGAAKV
jgi:Na+-driven multidrug efflux pump